MLESVAQGKGSMRIFLLRGVAALSLLGASLVSLSCGNQQLLRIQVLPANIIVAGTPTIIYQAVGHYSKTQNTKDITSQVAWKTSTPTIVAFSDPTHPNYLIPTGTGCGANIAVTASMLNNPNDPASGTSLIGPATVNVQCGTPTAGVDFGLTSTPTTVTASPGSTANYSILVVVKNGNPTIELQVSNLPAGATAVFTPPTVSGTTTSNLAVTTVPGTPAQTYHMKVTGTDSSGSLTLNLSLIVP